MTKVIRVEEYFDGYLQDDGSRYGREERTYYLDYEKAKLLSGDVDHIDKLWYTKDIVVAALRGSTYYTTSNKYSFNDTDWEAKALRPDVHDQNEWEIVHTIEVERGG